MPVAEAPAPEVAEGAAAGKKSGRLWLWIVLAVLVAGGGAGGWWWFAGANGAASKAAAHETPKAPPIYYALDPPFVANFQTEKLVRFLQVTVQLMSRDAHTVDLLKSNDPAIRNDLLLLYSNQSYAALSTREGMEKLRAETLATVRRVLTGVGGDPKLVEAAYFTSFVMQ